MISLAIAGLLAIVLVLARVPTSIAPAIDGELARRGLVVHVNLATGVWFFAFLAGLACLGRRVDGRRSPPPRPISRLPVILASAGMVAFTVPVLSGARVVLSDYVPVLDHWLFFAGLAAFAGGVLLETVRLVPAVAHSHVLPADVQHGVRASAIAFAIALLTILTAFVCRPAGASQDAMFEHLFWGGGHVLQFAATAGMLAAWLLLAHQLLGTSAMSSRLAGALFALLLLPASLGPWLIVSQHSPRSFTHMMELGIFPVVLVVSVVVIAAVRGQRRASEIHWPAQSIARIGLAVGIGMTLLGFALGAAITDDSTLTPAHYHISIGAVSVTFMATLFVLLQRFGVPIRRPRLAIWQPLVYGVGQTVFALGLAIAGFWGGSARKQYASELIASPIERTGWIVAGVGGLVAFAGGVAFVVIVIGSVARRR